MANSTQIVPPLGIDVSFWGIDIHDNDIRPEEGDKVKLCHLHPGSRPWVVCVDRDNFVQIWDYSTKGRLLKKNINEIITEAESSVVEKISHRKLPPRRISTQQCRSSRLFDTVILKRDEIFSPSTSLDSSQKSSAVSANPKLSIGNLRSLHFIDGSSIVNNSGDAFSPQVTPFNTETKIMIVADNAIIFYEFSSNKSRALVGADLAGARPMSADFICDGLCAVGCSDGAVRIWDCVKWKEVKSLLAHTKEVSIVKVLPILQ